MKLDPIDLPPAEPGYLDLSRINKIAIGWPDEVQR